jgi:hydrogenase maturation protease
MNQALVDRVVHAVLYEGYILYPYRPSLKNQQRWTFGGLYPEAYCALGTGDAGMMQTECLIEGPASAVVRAQVRFLHLTDRTVGVCRRTLEDYQPVPSLRVEGRMYYSWQEAMERQAAIADVELNTLLEEPRVDDFAFPASRNLEPIRNTAEETAGVLVREQQAVAGAVEMAAERLTDSLFRLSVRVHNRTSWQPAETPDRNAALLRTLVSTHVVLSVRNGAFVSSFDPPEVWREQSAACRNIGAWPVLVGEEGERDTVLASPIILYDYPQIAPESPGDLFDACEIDEILSLRILTLTDEEKQAVAAVDERARALLERTEALTAEQMGRLHGTIRSLRPLAGEPGPA